MTDPGHSISPTAEQAAHLALRLGRMMLRNGADTAQVQAKVATVARVLGHDVQLLVTSEVLLATVQSGESFRTKLGHPVSGMVVDMGALDALDALVRRIAVEGGDSAEIERSLDEAEARSSTYPRWAVAVGMGITAASLARLFGGAWTVVAVSFGVGIVSTALRQRFAAAGMNAVANAFLVALLSGLTGGLAMKVFPETMPTLCLVAAGMILVPGVPLINGVRDAIAGHIGMAMTRLSLGTMTVLAIGFGLFAAGTVLGDVLPVEGDPTLLPLTEDLAFSLLAAIGYALLFNVPSKAAWACLLCGMGSHGLRNGLAHLGCGLVAGSFFGALLAGILASFFARKFRVPAVTFAFPGVVAMIPGSYAFRAAIGGLHVMQQGAAASPGLVGVTAALAITTILMTAAIAIGLSLALSIFPPVIRMHAGSP